jgi:kanamycin kinase
MRPVWENELGGLTFEVREGEERWFVKWSPVTAGVDLEGEAERMGWASSFITVPRVVEGGVAEDGSWLMTVGLPGENAVAEQWIADPASAVRAIGQGLRAMHDALPVEDCPFSWSVDERLAAAGRLDLLEHAPSVDRLVVCHGDACSPNTLITDDGRCSGHVDLGALGVADRWADLAVATYSSIWNYGPGWEDALLDAYGIDADPARTAWYRMAWDLDA